MVHGGFLFAFASAVALTGGAGWMLSSTKRSATVSALVFLTLQLGSAAIAYNVHVLPEAYLNAWTVLFFQTWYAIWFTGLLCTGARDAFEQFKREREAGGKRALLPCGRRAGLYLFFAAVLVLFASMPLLTAVDAAGFARDRSTPAQVSKDGVVRQTTRYSCGAASAATLLRMTGADPEASEERMVPLCLTSRVRGSSSLGIALGLKRVAGAGGWRVKIVSVDAEHVSEAKLPAVGVVGYGHVTNHAVVVCAVDPNKGVKIADPMKGMRWWPWEEFKGRFKQQLVLLTRDVLTPSQ